RRKPGFVMSATSNLVTLEKARANHFSTSIRRGSWFAMKRACFESGASPYHLLIARFGFVLFPLVIFKQPDATTADENHIDIINVGVPFAMRTNTIAF